MFAVTVTLQNRLKLQFQDDLVELSNYQKSSNNELNSFDYNIEIVFINNENVHTCSGNVRNKLIEIRSSG